MNEIPEKIVINGVRHTLAESRENNYYRALVIPLNGGDPKWLTNDQVGELTNHKEGNER